MLKKSIFKRFASLFLVFCLLFPLCPTANAAGVNSSDITSLVNVAKNAVGSYPGALGLPTSNWCGYFAGYCINHSSIASSLGSISNTQCNYAVSIVNWVCNTKNAGVFYVASSAHETRVQEMYPALRNSGKVVSINQSSFTPAVGDFVQFTWSDWSKHVFDHVGIVTAVTGNTITYVDGNSGSGKGKVASHSMAKTSNSIIGYVRLNQSGSNPPSVPSNPTVTSQKEGSWVVTVPANYKLLLYLSAAATSNLTYKSASSGEYALRVDQEARLSDGSVRYSSVWDHQGTPTRLWFTLTGSMRVEDISHTTHQKGTFRYTATEHPHYNYYACSVCSQDFTDGSTSQVDNCAACGTDLRVVSQENVDWCIAIPANYVVKVYNTETSSRMAFSYAIESYIRYDRVDTKVVLSNGSTRFRQKDSEDRWFIFEDGMEIDKHNLGTELRHMSDHPHEQLAQCSVCDHWHRTGKFESDSSCEQCYPPLTLISQEEGKWQVTIPANHYLPLHDSATLGVFSSRYYGGREKAFSLLCYQRATLSDGTTRYAYTFDEDGQKVTVWLTLADGLTVDDKNHTTHTWDSGKITTQPGVGTPGIKTYMCTVCGAQKTEQLHPLPPVTPPTGFTDVPQGEFYADAVAWAVDNGITSGVSSTSFAPNDTCTRSQIVTFLWRAAGEPEPSSKQNPFGDVKSSDFFYKAVLWASEQGITSGTDNTHFSPKATCDRSQAVTFIWRAAGKPSSSGSSFVDVSPNQFYSQAVSWAVSKGITSGTSNTTFAPNALCTRGQIVTFLYRDMGL